MKILFKILFFIIAPFLNWFLKIFQFILRSQSAFSIQSLLTPLSPAVLIQYLFILFSEIYHNAHFELSNESTYPESPHFSDFQNQFFSTINPEADVSLAESLCFYIDSQIRTQNTTIINESFFENFYHDLRFVDSFQWLTLQPSLSLEILSKFFNFAPVIIIYASSSILPQPESFEEVSNEIQNLLDKIQTIPIFDPGFLRPEHSQQIVSMFTENDEIFLINSQFQDLEWKVFKLEKELVRGLWTNEIFVQLYCGCEIPERPSIQKEIFMLRNLIVQSLAFPLGYPSLVSPPMSSPITPFSRFFNK